MGHKDLRAAMQYHHPGKSAAHSRTQTKTIVRQVVENMITAEEIRLPVTNGRIRPRQGGNGRNALPGVLWDWEHEKWMLPSTIHRISHPLQLEDLATHRSSTPTRLKISPRYATCLPSSKKVRSLIARASPTARRSQN